MLKKTKLNTFPNSGFSLIEEVKLKMTNLTGYFNYWNFGGIGKLLSSDDLIILNQLRNDGIAIIRDFISKENLSRIREEHEEVMQDTKFNMPCVSTVKITEQLVRQHVLNGGMPNFLDMAK